MKTTIQLPDSLLNEVRKLAKEEQTILKALMEEGLRRIIAERRQRGSFKLRRVTFKGSGLQANMKGANWERIRDISYKGHGS